MDRAINDDLELFHADRFWKEVVSTLADRFHSVFLFSLTRDHQHLDQGVNLKDFGEREKPFSRVAGGRGQAEVQRHNSRPILLQDIQSGATVLRHKNVVLGIQSPAHLGSDFIVIVNN
jgi:hypothetical protein